MHRRRVNSQAGSRVLVERTRSVTQFSKRLAALPTYPMAEIPTIKRRLVQQGVDVIDVGAGDPAFAPPGSPVAGLARAPPVPAWVGYAFRTALPASAEPAPASWNRPSVPPSV